MTDTVLHADTREIVVDEVFPHAPATIWKTLATNDLMGRWLKMTPTGFEPVVGNRFTYQTSPAGAWDGTIQCEVLEVVPGERLAYSGIEMDIADHKVRRDGISLALGPTEFRLLRHFLEHPGRVFSRERLLDSVWGRDSDIEPRTVDVHIRRLRKAINLEGLPDIIRTVRSAGYALDLDEAA